MKTIQITHKKYLISLKIKKSLSNVSDTTKKASFIERKATLTEWLSNDGIQSTSAHLYGQTYDYIGESQEGSVYSLWNNKYVADWQAMCSLAHNIQGEYNL